MKNEIIFGSTGSGKTGYLVDNIVKFIDNNEKYLIVILEDNNELIHRLPENYKNNPNIVFKSNFEEMLLEGINNKLNTAQKKSPDFRGFFRSIHIHNEVWKLDLFATKSN